MTEKKETIILPNNLLQKVDNCCENREEWITDAIQQKIKKINDSA